MKSRSRKFPCANCTKSNTQCVPAATLARRPRRRRFPERELLDRLRRYESLLRQNNIDFEPAKKRPSILEKGSLDASPDTDGGRGGYESLGDEQPASPSTTVKSETVYQAK